MQATGPVLVLSPPASPIPAHLIKFLEVMRGTRMAAPTRLLPVMKMPLHRTEDRALVERQLNNC